MSITTIDQDLRKRTEACITESCDVIFERRELIRGIWVARISQQHVLMVGKPGIAKTMTARHTVQHISDARYFESDVHEQSTVDDLFGGLNIKGLVEQGLNRRILTNTLAEATDGMLDEVMNANDTLKHALLPALNERTFKNGDILLHTPIRQILSGTNHADASTDPALHAFWDRYVLRYEVNALKKRDSRFGMVMGAIARMAASGRGTATTADGIGTTVTVAELDQANAESLALSVEDATMTLYDDIWLELQTKGIELSDRRYVEGMAAVLANAWLNNHPVVQVGDLDILANIWWDTFENLSTARSVIMEVTNPGEKAALELLDQLDAIKSELQATQESSADANRKTRAVTQAVTTANRLQGEAEDHITNFRAAGTNVQRLEEVVQRAETFKEEVASKYLGLGRR